MPRKKKKEAIIDRLNTHAKEFYEATVEAVLEEDNPEHLATWLKDCDLDPTPNGMTLSYSVWPVGKWTWAKIFMLSDVDGVRRDLVDINEVFHFLKKHEASIAKAQLVLKEFRAKAEAYRAKHS